MPPPLLSHLPSNSHQVVLPSPAPNGLQQFVLSQSPNYAPVCPGMESASERPGVKVLSDLAARQRSFDGTVRVMAAVQRLDAWMRDIGEEPAERGTCALYKQVFGHCFHEYDARAHRGLPEATYTWLTAASRFSSPDSDTNMAAFIAVLPDASPGVEAFVLRRDLLATYLQVRQLIVDSFPGLAALRAVRELDPEIPDCEQISFEASVKATAAQALAGEDRFVAEFCRRVPAVKRTFFVLQTVLDE